MLCREKFRKMFNNEMPPDIYYNYDMPLDY